jgi:RND family efflux transporter MFP subunit
MISSNEPHKRSTGHRRWRRMLVFVLCLMIVAAGLVLAEYIKKTAPKAQRRPPDRNIPRVETMALFPGDHQVVVSAMGTVAPAREMTLKSRVSGQVQSVHPEFVAGGIVVRGQRLIKIDPQDYQLALARKESEVINSQYELKVELGFQDVARREWSLLNKGTPADAADEELALRKPHLAKARSDLAAAQAELEQAKLNLARTDITAPFNAIIQETYVEIGSQVSTQDALADLVGTDEYWIRVALPVDRLRWIRLPSNRPETGALAVVHFRGYKRDGHVIRLLGDLEPQGRMARIMVSVVDPLGRGDRESGQPLLIGEYVRVEIQGETLTDVYRIPRSGLRDNNTIWLVAADETLQIKPVDMAWSDDRHVLIRDRIAPGDRLVVSDLAAPVDGMPVEAILSEPVMDKSASGSKDATNG